jgi:hypothetical protein
MGVLNDIKALREHYTNRWKWYLAAIDRLESDIQFLWNDYFLSRGKIQNNTIKLLEIEKSFELLKTALDYFRSNAAIVEKRLDDLDKQEYAIINTNDEPIN